MLIRDSIQNRSITGRHAKLSGAHSRKAYNNASEQTLGGNPGGAGLCGRDSASSC